MNIIYFFTYNVSLNTWKESGQEKRELSRLLKVYNDTGKGKLYIFTYGDKTESSFELPNSINNESIQVIPIYKYFNKSKFKLINFLRSFFYTKKMLKNENFDLTDADIIYTNQLLGSWVAYTFKKRLKIPLIVRTGYDLYEFSILENKSLIKRLFYKYLTHFSLNFSDIYTVTSNSDKNFLIGKFKIKDESKIKIRPNWIKLRASNFNIKDWENRHQNKLVSVGRLEDQKNYSRIIEALKNTNFELDLYGEGSLKEQLMLQAKSLDVKVNFMGIKDNNDLLNELEKYKFYISSSLFEGNPKGLLEAMSAGCVVIASNIKNHVEFLNNENSILFSNNDDSLEKIIKNLNSPEINFSEIVNNSFRTIKETYEFEKIINKEINDIYLLTK